MTIWIKTRQDHMQTVYHRWRDQYEYEIKHNLTKFNWKHTPLEIAEKLKNIVTQDTINREDIDSLIGNRTWTELICDRCKEDYDKLVIISKKPFWDQILDHRDEENIICKLCPYCAALIREVLNDL